jgi:hypothetical protein
MGDTTKTEETKAAAEVPKKEEQNPVDKALAELRSQISTLSSRVSSAEGTLSTVGSNVGSLQTDVNRNGRSIVALDERLSAVEDTPAAPENPLNGLVALRVAHYQPGSVPAERREVVCLCCGLLFRPDAVLAEFATGEPVALDRAGNQITRDAALTCGTCRASLPQETEDEE